MIWTQDGYQPRSRLDDMKPAPTSSPASNESSDDSRSKRETAAAPDPSSDSPRNSYVWSEQVNAKFLESLCPTSEFYKTDPGTIWLHQALTSSHGCKPLELVLKALAAVRVGWAQKNEDLRRHGSSLYGKALKGLQEALYDRKLASEEYTFVAARAMVTYEHYMSTSSTPQAWASHVNGLMMILMNRGPLPFKTTCGRAAMEDVRDTMVCRSRALWSRY